MAINKKYFDKAVDVLAVRRAANEQNLILRRQIIAEKIPQYTKLEKELSMTSAKLAMLIFNRNDNFKVDFDALEERNLSIQKKMENLLISNCFETDYLEKKFTCNKCKDTGIFNNEWCECFHEVMRSIASRELNEQSPMSLCSFDTFDLTFYSENVDTSLGVSPRKVMTSRYEYCKDYADNFHIPNEGILMTGKTGLGKTHLSLSIANVVIKQGYNVVYGSSPDLLRQIEKEHFGRSSENDTLEIIENADLLIFDDLGAEFESQFYVAAIYNILNTRINRRMPTIVNTNLTASELKQRYTDRIVSRLYSMKQLAFCGNDIRIIKH